jgi:hypothetical protein
MVTKTPEITDRKPRADAQRNRERVLEVAKHARGGTGPRWKRLPQRNGSVANAVDADLEGCILT